MAIQSLGYGIGGGPTACKGLGPEWTYLFANDFTFKKGLTYQANFGALN